MPSFGDTCVCCAAATEETVAYDPSGEGLAAQRLEVPCCEPCSEHLGTSHTASNLAVLGIAVGALGTLTMGGAAIASGGEGAIVLGALACGLVPMASGAVVLALIDRRHRQRIASGHHPIDIRVGIGRCVIHTTNATLADELQALNPSARRLT